MARLYIEQRIKEGASLRSLGMRRRLSRRDFSYLTLLTASSLSFSLSLTQSSRSMSVRFRMVMSCMVMVPFGGTMMVPMAGFSSISSGMVGSSLFSV